MYRMEAPPGDLISRLEKCGGIRCSRSVLFVFHSFAYLSGNCRLVQHNDILFIHRILDRMLRNPFYHLSQLVLFLHLSSPFHLQYYIYSLYREEY